MRMSAAGIASSVNVMPVRLPASLRSPSGSACGPSVRWPSRTQHPFARRSPHGKQKGSQGIHIGPLRVVDDHRYGDLLFEIAQHVQQPGPDGRRLLGRERRGTAGQQRPGADPGHPPDLVDHAVSDVGLPRLAGCTQHGQIRLAVEQLLDQRGLADPGFSFDEHHLRYPGTHGAQFCAKGREPPARRPTNGERFSATDISITSVSRSPANADPRGARSTLTRIRSYRTASTRRTMNEDRQHAAAVAQKPGPMQRRPAPGSRRGPMLGPPSASRLRDAQRAEVSGQGYGRRSRPTAASTALTAARTARATQAPSRHSAATSAIRRLIASRSDLGNRRSSSPTASANIARAAVSTRGRGRAPVSYVGLGVVLLGMRSPAHRPNRLPERFSAR